jgi:hypothetical protein
MSEKQQREPQSDSEADNPRVIVLTPPASAMPEAKPTWIKAVEQITLLSRATIWPILVALILIVYSSQINGLIKAASKAKLSVPGFSVEVERQARKSGGYRLVAALNDLDPKDVEKLLNTGRGINRLVGQGTVQFPIILPPKPEMGSIRNLEEKGLLRLTNGKNALSLSDFEAQLKTLPLKKADPEEQTKFDRPAFAATATLSTKQKQLLETEYSLTELGEQAFDSIISAVTEQLSHSKEATSDSPDRNRER